MQEKSHLKKNQAFSMRRERYAGKNDDFNDFNGF
jgi:hypothetical protein